MRSAQSFLIERKGAQLGGANQVRVVKTGKGHAVSLDDAELLHAR